MDSVKLTSHEILNRYKNDPELAKEFPKHPNFPSEYRVIPFGSEAILIIGGTQRQVLNTNIEVTGLRSILCLMDGSRTLGEIEGASRRYLTNYEISSEDILSLISCLHDLGLLEDGSIKSNTAYPDTDAFLGRMCGGSGSCSNRNEIWQRLFCAEIGLVGNDLLCRRMKSHLRYTGLNISELKKANLILVLYHSRSDLEQCQAQHYDLLTSAEHDSYDVLFLGIIGNCVQFGPFTSIHHMKCLYDWLLADFFTKEAASFDPDQSHVEFWCAYLASRVFNVIAGLDEMSVYEAIAVIELDANNVGYEERLFAISSYIGPKDILHLGDSQCGLEALLVGATFSSCEIPPLRFFSPRVHRKHYTAKNIALTKTTRPTFYGVHKNILPSINQAIEDPTIIINAVSIICFGAFGEYQSRRMTPTGGNLGALELILVCAPGCDVKEGVYRYQPGSHSIERLGRFPRNVGLVEETRSILFIIVSLYQRVYEKYEIGAFKITGLDAGVAATAARWAAWTCDIDLQTRSELDLTKLEAQIGLPFLDDRYSSAVALEMMPAKTLDTLEKQVLHTENICLPESVQQNEGALDHDRILFNTLHMDKYLLERSKRSLVSDVRIKQKAPNSLVSLREYFSLIQGRRAQRLFTNRVIPQEILDMLPRAAHFAAGQHCVQVMSYLSFWVFDWGRGTLIQLDVSTGQLTRTLLRNERIFNQTLLLTAPASLVVSASIKRLALELGSTGFKFAFQAAGAALHHAWLIIELHGLNGCIAGGVIPKAFTSVIPSSSHSEQPLAAFCFGEAES